ncbi:hypothetical protein LUZ60_003957 [Juncus effusus]|nr:hypothetical protein LUZ60_003957 [Juncus effusus]
MAISVPNFTLSYPNPRILPCNTRFIPRRAIPVTCASRTGKRRYPSEKKRLEKIRKGVLKSEIPNKEEGFWRLSKLKVPAHKDPGKDFVGISDALLEAIAKSLKFPVPAMLPKEGFIIVRKSFDARKALKEPAFVYTVDIDVKKLLELEPRTWDFISELEQKIGITEYFPHKTPETDLKNLLQNDQNTPRNNNNGSEKRPKVAVIGSGPAGLFAALVLAEVGADVTVIERGQPVEIRGRDIGALVVRKILQTESNFCFGEGGAGTWSDGKLVTRIGRNSDSVQAVLKALVEFGAPPNILIDGKPHLGTDRLVPLLRNFRNYLLNLGVEMKFGTRLDDLIIENGRIKGIVISDSKKEVNSENERLLFDNVVLAVGHSARDVYEMLLRHNVDIVPKNFAVGLRIEHPQELINSIQYSKLADEVREGRGKIPVADYKLVKYINNENYKDHKNDDYEQNRSCYSFCMCPGGQVVLTSTNASELCINGMSFSKRASKWANSALVVSVSSNDFNDFTSFDSLAGVEFQREFERRAAIMGGGNFVVPAQCVTDFLDNKLSIMSLPPSSYRLGVKASKLHEIYPSHITEALQKSIHMFDRELPGFISKDALLHGVETRTSSPVQIRRHVSTCESTNTKGIFPIGEGAGYAGGIVSAAVDGLFCGFALAKELNLFEGDLEGVIGRDRKQSGFVKY